MDATEKYDDIQIEDIPEIEMANSVMAVDPQDIIKLVTSSDAQSANPQSTPFKSIKRKRTKEEKEELKKKYKYFKLVCGGEFGEKKQQ